MHTMSRQRIVCLQLMVQILLCSYSTITQLATLGVPFLVITSTIAQLDKINYINSSKAESFYHKISNHTLDGGLSTVVNKLCICWQQNSSNCTNNIDGTIVYPGMTLHFPMSAYDVFNQVTFAEISLMLLTYNSSLVTGAFHKIWYLDSPAQMMS